MTPGSIVLMHPGWLGLLLLMFIFMLGYQHLSRRLQLHKMKHAAESDIVHDSGNLASSVYSNQYILIHPLFRLIPKTKPSSRKYWANFVLFWLVITCLVISLCQPVRVGKPLSMPPPEKDIVFIVDTSLSMILRDYVYQGKRIERISVLKQLLTNFVQRLEGERIAIVVFGETAQTLVPLTRDKQLLTSMITRITAGMIGRENAMGDAITLAVHEAEHAKQRNRILVFFTDAGDDTGHVAPLAAAKLAADAGLPLYTIAIGASTNKAAESSRFPGLIYQTVNTTLLKALSHTTNAISYNASDSKSLQRTIKNITRNTIKQRNTTPHYVLKSLYLWPLIFGLFIFTAQQFLRHFRAI